VTSFEEISKSDCLKYFSPLFIFGEKNKIFRVTNFFPRKTFSLFKKPQDDGSNQRNARHGKEATNRKKTSE
jgi:hypothetical protein